ncbi:MULTISPECIES: hypothetical protein [Protofrankia]|uniref:Uncharacterized protein n=1 Tax=Candidatus Protofrankia californiensis TaxID=1839754 RepID=A0A1C3NZW7_9ACTN|nr:MULTISPECIES: hypothetical protein [Protofrankia]SBW23109.1 hypothetical protein FDG2_3582 [Candidatus Protofrankia californiensis]
MAVSDHEMVLELGMSKQELIRTVEAGVPPRARLASVDGDVDLTLIWRVRDGAAWPDADAAAAAEERAWRVWIEADARAQELARAERAAFEQVAAARDAWREAVRVLAQVAPAQAVDPYGLPVAPDDGDTPPDGKREEGQRV